MTLATNAFHTYPAEGGARGNREDLSDEIYRIDPFETPFFSNIEREPATNTLHEWQTQALAAAVGTNFQLEGDDNVAADVVTPTVRLGNYTQIQIKITRVTGTQEVVDHAGRGSEMSYQISLRGKELKRDIETTMVGTNQAKAVGSTTAARKMASVLSWIKGNTDFSAAGTPGADPATADGAATRTDGSVQRAFTEAQLKNVLQKIWTAGGTPDTIMMGGFNKQVFSSFVGRGTPTQDQAQKKITASVDLYQSDFGNLEAKPNRFMRARDVLVLDMSMWASSPLTGREFINFDLAKTGDSDKKQMLIEHSLVARNQLSSGGVFDLTTS